MALKNHIINAANSYFGGTNINREHQNRLKTKLSALTYCLEFLKKANKKDAYDISFILNLRIALINFREIYQYTDSLPVENAIATFLDFCKARQPIIPKVINTHSQAYASSSSTAANSPSRLPAESTSEKSKFGQFFSEQRALSVPTDVAKRYSSTKLQLKQAIQKNDVRQITKHIAPLEKLILLYPKLNKSLATLIYDQRAQLDSSPLNAPFIYKNLPERYQVLCKLITLQFYSCESQDNLTIHFRKYLKTIIDTHLNLNATRKHELNTAMGFKSSSQSSEDNKFAESYFEKWCVALKNVIQETSDNLDDGVISSFTPKISPRLMTG